MGDNSMKARTQPIPFGGAMLREDRPVCAFFISVAEEYDTLLPFVCDGLNCGHRAYHVLPDHHKEDYLQRLRNAGIDVVNVMKSRQLEVAVPEDTYLRTGGSIRTPCSSLSRTP